MSKWYMLTLVGKDRPGIVSHVAGALYEGGCNLGEASMMRLGGNFTIMLMVKFDGKQKQLEDLVRTVAESMELKLHVDAIDAELHHHVIPDIRISVYGADRAGIVAKVTQALEEVGFNILDLESDVAGTEEKPIYIMHIEGTASEGFDAIKAILDIMSEEEGVDTKISQIDTLIG
jgi:glycine cleavage system transcriptional repressor